ncbi:MarR family transcriptional regulator [Frankia sp. CNm7]|uniref:MarR family transcriptional regulator n=1 Tax=Frankia nepalensis TaxID=1836974 RepID=A0A937USH3_9ACTN|nr:MarR family transcriptional regulator [Frankia nepalensis]MBL7495260.1 MarR family transcriptional regulator [Frankia nepalensis]MBL7515807.1 MarR family transcriptional regulator [Frankia nepalensis]MBL7521413.1 MarR family transcriptional regulator [Frankia nepalensis]MBL7632477.1 MarR family transcriptional regulator [Frankia nepalensis]
MPKHWNRDPIQAAYDLWVAKGWEDTADGMIAVTSLLRVHQLLMARADEILAPVELSFARYEVLVVLYFNEDAVPLSYLAKALQLHQASVTNLINKLEKQGYLERRAHPSDRRVTLAQITRTGRARTRTAIRRLNSELFSQLGLTVEETRAMVSIFAKMRHAWGDTPQDGGTDATGALLPVAQSTA